MTREIILHLTSAADFDREPGSPYVPPAFEKDGFIHCTREPEVMLQVANQFYREAPGDMIVLVIDPARVQAEVKYEPPAHPQPDEDKSGPLFPHIYGPLNRDAIVGLRRAWRAADGTYLAV